MNYFTKMAVGISVALPLFASAAASSTMPIPVHVSPANNAVLTSSLFTMADWTDVSVGSSSLLYYFEMSKATSTDTEGGFTLPSATSSLLASSSYPTVGQAEGVYYWHVRSADTEGNKSVWSAPFMVTIDNTAPTAPGALVLVSSVAPVIGTTTASSTASTTPQTGTQVWSFGTSTDNGSFVAKYQYNVSGTSTWTDNGLLTSFTTMLGVGNYTISVRAFDGAGNISTSTSASLSVNASSTVSTSTPVVTKPSAISQCKKSGWRTFTSPRFKNQGQCVSYVEKMLRDKKKEDQRLKLENKKKQEEIRKALKKHEEERKKAVEKIMKKVKEEKRNSTGTTSSTSRMMYSEMGNSSGATTSWNVGESTNHGNGNSGNKGNSGSGNNGKRN